MIMFHRIRVKSPRQIARQQAFEIRFAIFVQKRKMIELSKAIAAKNQGASLNTFFGSVFTFPEVVQKVSETPVRASGLEVLQLAARRTVSCTTRRMIAVPALRIIVTARVVTLADVDDEPDDVASGKNIIESIWRGNVIKLR